MERIVASLRQAMRGMMRNPAFSVASILTLALGIGANALVYGVTRAVFFTPLPFAREGELVSIGSMETNPDATISDFAMTEIDAVRIPKDNHTLVGAGGAWPGAVAVTGEGDPQTVQAARVTATLWPVLGATPIAGRVFTQAEDVPGNGVVVISERYQRAHFAGTAGAALGRTITMDGQTRRVIGVMPSGFSPALDDSDLWTPMELDESRLQDVGTSFIQIIGRRKPGVSDEAVNRDLRGIAQQLSTEFPVSHKGIGIRARPLRAVLSENVSGLSLSMTFAVLMLLLLACANVTNLMLARAMVRRGEVSTKLALGGSRSGILADHAMDGLVVGLCGGLLGVFIASNAFTPLMSVAGSAGILSRARVDGAVIAATILASMLMGVACAVAAGWYALRLAGGSALAGGGRRMTAGAGEHRTRRTLMTAQIALATVLLTGCFAMVLTLRRLSETPLGFRTDDITVARMTLATARFPDLAHRYAFVRRALDELEATPGITSAGMTSNRFAPNENLVSSVRAEGVGNVDSAGIAVSLRRVTADYFASMDIRPVRGRLFNAADRDSTLPVAVVNASFAKQFFGTESPLDHRVRRVGNAKLPWLTVVGVVPDVRDGGPGVDLGPALYVPYTQSATGAVTLVVRSALPRDQVARALRRAVSAADAMQPIDDIQSMQNLLSSTMGQQKFKAIVLSSLALLALVLACTGVAGVTAFIIAQRTREIGLRKALGSTTRGVVAFLLGESARWVGAGVLVGVVLSRLVIMQSTKLLPEVVGTKPSVYAAAVVALLVAGLLATLLPALRAAGIAPGIAMRADDR